MQRSDWKPALLLCVASALLLFTVLTLAGPWLKGRLGGPPLPDTPLPEKPASVDLWVGDLAPGVKGVLTAVFNEPEPDAKEDESLNVGLGLEGGRALAYYQFFVFNASDRPYTATLRDGDLIVTPKGGAPVPMRSLRGILSGGASAPSLSVAAFFAAKGSNRDEIEIPPGKSISPFVAFEKRVALGQAVSVARVDGTAFRMRPIPRQVWDELSQSPSFADLKGL